MFTFCFVPGTNNCFGNKKKLYTIGPIHHGGITTRGGTIPYEKTPRWWLDFGGGGF